MAGNAPFTTRPQLAGTFGMVASTHWLKIYPPNQTAPLYLSFTTPACAKPAHILGIQAVQSGKGGG